MRTLRIPIEMTEWPRDAHAETKPAEALDVLKPSLFGYTFRDPQKERDVLVRPRPWCRLTSRAGRTMQRGERGSPRISTWATLCSITVSVNPLNTAETSRRGSPVPSIPECLASCSDPYACEVFSFGVTRADGDKHSQNGFVRIPPGFPSAFT